MLKAPAGPQSIPGPAASLVPHHLPAKPRSWQGGKVPGGFSSPRLEAATKKAPLFDV